MNFIVGYTFEDSLKQQIEYCYDTDASSKIDIIDVINLLRILVLSSWLRR